MKKLFQLIVFILIISSVSNCTTAIIDDEDIITPINSEVKYNPDVKNIMFNNCTSCHGGSAPDSGLDLSSYQNVRNATEKGNILNRINDGANPMPPSGLLNAQDRAVVEKWKEEGYLSN